MNISFKYFFREYRWLFLAAILIPLICISLYCIIYYDINLDAAVWATIISALISYIGTVAWGIFIYYDSWQRKKEQEYRDRPRIRAGCVSKTPEQAFYTYEEVCGRPIKPNEKGSDAFLYLKVRLVNNGSHSLFNFKPCLVLIYDSYGGDIEQKPRWFLNPSTDIIAFKESFDIFVGVLKTAIGPRANAGLAVITYVFSFQDDLMNIYYCRCVMKITDGKKRFSDDLYLYTEDEYNTLMNEYERIKNTCQYPYSKIFGI